METHVKVLGVLYIVLSALGTLAALMIILVFGAAGAAAAASASSGDAAVALPVIAAIGGVLATFLLIVSLPGFVAGFGLLNYKPWARILTIVLSVLNLFNVPFGTFVGAYGLWVMLSEEGARLFTPTPAAPPAPTPVA
jgi:hypothetical protein